MTIFINTAALKSRNDACYHCFSTHLTVIDRNRYLFYLYFRVYIYIIFKCSVWWSIARHSRKRQKNLHPMLFSRKAGWSQPESKKYGCPFTLSLHYEKHDYIKKNPKLRMALNVTEHGLFLLFHIQALMVHCGKTAVNSAGWLNWDRY